MKKIYFLLCAIIIACNFSVNAQNNITDQSFEGNGSWTYSEYPSPYTVYTSASDRWGIWEAILQIMVIL